jgi:peptide/nickel transport system substrate-binding protein
MNEMLVCAAAAATSFAARSAMAQKQGGRLTIGIELDIPGFDPLKVGVSTGRGLKCWGSMQHQGRLGVHGRAQASKLNPLAA